MVYKDEPKTEKMMLEKSDKNTIQKPKKSVKKQLKKIEKVELKVWINRKIQERRFRPEQLREIEIFMKKQNLKDQDEIEKYEEALKKF